MVEDNATMREQVHEYLNGQEIAGRALEVEDVSDIDAMMSIIQARKADLIVLDVYRGEAIAQGERIGIKVLNGIKKSGFVSVVLYTALPEGLEEHQGPFVRLVGKEHGGLKKLMEEIKLIFQTKMPQIHRATIDHLDQSLGLFMWGFVAPRWSDLKSIADKPEFFRLILQRLASAMSREGVSKAVESVYDNVIPDTLDKIHVTEFYVMPPMSTDPMLGDIRMRSTGGKDEFLVVLWPSCDMVTSGNRTAKTEAVLCAKADMFDVDEEVVAWVRDGSTTKAKAVEKLIRNRRDDRLHFLPGVWEIPNLIVDFQKLEYVQLADVRALKCLGTMASPFAEEIASRFQRYTGRIGTPDLDPSAIMADAKARLRNGA